MGKKLERNVAAGNANTSVESELDTVAVVGEDVDLLVLLMALSSNNILSRSAGGCWFHCKQSLEAYVMQSEARLHQFS